MGIIADFKPYTDQYGLTTLETKGEIGVTTQNGQLFTAEYLIALEAIKPDGFEDEVQRIRTAMDRLEIHSGTTLRYPTSTEGNSMDNNCAALVFSALYGESGYAKRMKDHGENVAFEGVAPDQGPQGSAVQFVYAFLLAGFKVPKYYWNNTKPGWFAGWGWYGRSPGFLGLIDLCATRKTTFLRKLSLLIGQFLGCFAKKDNTDARKLPFVCWWFLKDLNWKWRLAYNIWKIILIKTYGIDGMREVFKIYYRDPNHPIHKWGISSF